MKSYYQSPNVEIVCNIGWLLTKLELYIVYKNRSPTVVRIVERRGGNYCCKVTQIFLYDKIFSGFYFFIKKRNGDIRVIDMVYTKISGSLRLEF